MKGDLFKKKAQAAFKNFQVENEKKNYFFKIEYTFAQDLQVSYFQRKMKRVNSVWWELFYRDFGKVHSKDFSGNIRDLYEVKKKATEDTEKSLLKIAQLPPPPPPPF